MRCDTKEAEKLIYEFLLTSKKPVKAKILAEYLETSERMVRRLIRDLIAQGNPIASTMEPPYGYFLVKTEKERQRYSNQLKSRIREIARRLEDFDRITAQKIQQLLLIEE
jgi:predicted DNA-binding transcriptional regulator YafY